jgi:hypothetical protein
MNVVKPPAFRDENHTDLAARRERLRSIMRSDQKILSRGHSHSSPFDDDSAQRSLSRRLVGVFIASPSRAQEINET